MKKITILSLLLIWFLLNTVFVHAQSQSDCTVGTHNPLWENNPLCITWKSSMTTKCSNAWWFDNWDWLDCKCTLFPGTPLQMINSCDSVPTPEDLACYTCEQEWFSHENGKCMIPWMNPLTGEPANIPVDCDNIEQCVSIGWEYYWWGQCCNVGSIVVDGECRPCSALSEEEFAANPWKCSDDVSNCAAEKIYTENWQQKCCPWVIVPDQDDSTKKVCIVNNYGNAWINMNSDCLINWQCSYNIYKTLGIRKSDQNPSVKSFAQDIVLAATTFIGTVIALILIISWVLYTVSAIRGDSHLADMAKKGITGSLVWLVLVVSSYAIVRLIQFVATAGGW